MNREDIIRMAKEASGHDFVGPRTIEFAERFAALVAAEKDKEIMALVQASALVAAAEREACAKVCEEKKSKYEERSSKPEDARDIDPEVARIAKMTCDFNAAAIRARGEK